MTLDGFSHTSLISLLVANRTKFFLSLIVEALILGLWLSLSCVVVRSLTILSMMGGLLVGDHLAWRHRSKDVLLSLPLEAIVIRSPIVDDTSIKLPWSPKKKVANGHWNDITLQSVFVSSDLERNLYPMLDLHSAEVA